jgi:hypothetical protein
MSVSEDEQKPRRRASERAVDPVARTLLATAEGHQDYIDNIEDLFVPPFWFDWLTNWILGSLCLVGGGLAVVVYWVQWSPLALPLGLVLLVLGGAALAYPWTRRGRQRARSESGKG